MALLLYLALKTYVQIKKEHQPYPNGLRTQAASPNLQIICKDR